MNNKFNSKINKADQESKSNLNFYSVNNLNTSSNSNLDIQFKKRPLPELNINRINTCRSVTKLKNIKNNKVQEKIVLSKALKNTKTIKTNLINNNSASIINKRTIKENFKEKKTKAIKEGFNAKNLSKKDIEISNKIKFEKLQKDETKLDENLYKTKIDLLNKLATKMLDSYVINESRNHIMNLKQYNKELEHEEISNNKSHLLHINEVDLNIKEALKLLNKYEEEEISLNNCIKNLEIELIEENNAYDIFKNKYNDILKNKDSILFDISTLEKINNNLFTDFEDLKALTINLLKIKDENEKTRVNIMNQNLILKPFYKKFLILECFTSYNQISKENIKELFLNYSDKYKISDNKKTISIKTNNNIEATNEFNNTFNKNEVSSIKNNLKKNNSNNNNNNNINANKIFNNLNNTYIFKADNIISLFNNDLEEQLEINTINNVFICKEIKNIYNAYFNKLKNNTNEINQLSSNKIQFSSVYLTNKDNGCKFNQICNIIGESLFDVDYKYSILEIKENGIDYIYEDLMSNTQPLCNIEIINKVDTLSTNSKIKTTNNLNFNHNIAGYIIKVKLANNDNDFSMLYLYINLNLNNESYYISKSTIIDLIKYNKNSSQAYNPKDNHNMNNIKKLKNNNNSNNCCSNISDNIEYASKNINLILKYFDLNKVKYSNLFIDIELDKLENYIEYLDLLNI